MLTRSKFDYQSFVGGPYFLFRVSFLYLFWISMKKCIDVHLLSVSFIQHSLSPFSLNTCLPSLPLGNSIIYLIVSPLSFFCSFFLGLLLVRCCTSWISSLYPLYLVYLFCCLIEFLSTRPLLTCKFLLLSPFHQIQRLFSLHRTHWEQTVFYKYY